MNNNLLICESKKDAQLLIKKADNLPYPLKNIDILSMHPEIRYVLECHHISSMTSADFINREDYELINSDCEKIYLTLLENVKQYISGCKSWCDENMFMYFTYYAFYTIAWNTRLLKNLLSLEQYNTILTYSPGKNVNESPWFLPEQNILHLLLSQVLANKSFEHVILKKDETEKRNYVSSSFLLAVRQVIRPVYSLILKRISSRDKNSCIVMIPSTGKNMHILCSDLAKKYNNIFFFRLWGGESILSELYNLYILLKFLITRKGVHDSNMQEGRVVKLSLTLLNPLEVEKKSKISSDSYNKLMLGMRESELKLNILDAVEIIQFVQINKIQHILTYIEYERSLTLGLEKILELCRRTDMIISQMSVGAMCELGYLAEKNGIPSMLISHGSHVLHTDGVAKLEHELSSNNLLVGGYRFLGIQTALSNEYVVNRQIPNQSIVKIKPIIFSNNISKRKIKGQKLTVLHASTCKEGGNRFTYETPNELLETFQETIEILSTCQNIQLIIKFRQLEAFSYKSLKMLLGPLPDNVSLVSDGPIGDFLGSSHLLMSFSSTTIEEALINDTPVLLYGGKGRYSHIPTDPFKLGVDDIIMKPVTFVDNKKSLTDYFKILNKNHLQFIDHQFDFDRFRLKDSIGVVDWLEQNSIL